MGIFDIKPSQSDPGVEGAIQLRSAASGAKLPTAPNLLIVPAPAVGEIRPVAQLAGHVDVVRPTASALGKPFDRVALLSNLARSGDIAETTAPGFERFEKQVAAVGKISKIPEPIPAAIQGSSVLDAVPVIKKSIGQRIADALAALPFTKPKAHPVSATTQVPIHTAAPTGINAIPAAGMEYLEAQRDNILKGGNTFAPKPSVAPARATGLNERVGESMTYLEAQEENILKSTSTVTETAASKKGFLGRLVERAQTAITGLKERVSGLVAGVLGKKPIVEAAAPVAESTIVHAETSARGMSYAESLGKSSLNHAVTATKSNEGMFNKASQFIGRHRWKFGLGAAGVVGAAVLAGMGNQGPNMERETNREGPGAGNGR